MKKRTLILLTICLALSATSTYAQQRPSEADRNARFEKFKAEREAFISKAMELTNEEKKTFWPLCNELQMKKFELNKTLRDETRKINRARREKQTIPEADYKHILELGSRVKIQEAQLEQEYLNKFLQVVPAEKVFLYQQSERSFGEQMIREQSNRNPQRLSDDARKRMEKEREKLQTNRTERTKQRAELAAKRAEKAQLQAERLKARAEKEQQSPRRGV
jgi:hypothetical protein